MRGLIAAGCAAAEVVSVRIQGAHVPLLATSPIASPQYTAWSRRPPIPEMRCPVIALGLEHLVLAPTGCLALPTHSDGLIGLSMHNKEGRPSDPNRHPAHYERAVPPLPARLGPLS